MKVISLCLLVLAFIFVWPGRNSSAYISGGSDIDYLNKNLIPGVNVQNIGTTVPAALPNIPNLPKLNISNLNIGGSDWGLLNLKTGDLSFNDLSSAFRSVLVLAINLFLIIIQTVAAILKALLPFLNK